MSHPVTRFVEHLGYPGMKIPHTQLAALEAIGEAPASIKRSAEPVANGVACVASSGHCRLYSWQITPDTTTTATVLAGRMPMPMMCYVCGRVVSGFRSTGVRCRRTLSQWMIGSVHVVKWPMPTCTDHVRFSDTCVAYPSGHFQYGVPIAISGYAFSRNFVDEFVRESCAGEYIPPWVTCPSFTVHETLSVNEIWWQCGYAAWVFKMSELEREEYYRRWRIPDEWREALDYHLDWYRSRVGGN